MVTDNLCSVCKSMCYLKALLGEKREKDGIVMATDKSCDFFDEEVELETHKILESNGECTAGKDLR